MARGQDYITEVRNQTRALWNALNALKAAQREYNALDYGNTLPDGAGENAGVTKMEVGAVVFATADAISALLDQGHATNMGKLL